MTLAWGWAAPTSAQTIPNDQFSADRFTPAPGPDNYLMVDGAIVGGHVSPSLGLIVDYAHRPFVLFTATCAGGDENDCEVEESEVDIVSYEVTGSLMGTLSLFQRLQLGLVVPVTATSGDSFRVSTPNLAEPYLDIRGGDAVGLGDPEISAKVRVLGKGREGFSLALGAYTTVPLADLANEGRNLGEESVTAGGNVIGEVVAGRLRVAANAGGVYRPERQLLSTEVGPELVYGVAGGFRVTSLLEVIGELTGATQLTSQLDENPIEFRAGARLSQGDVKILLAGGAGILSGVGVPNFRAIAGVSWEPAGLDSDGDGVDDEQDACPSELEDRDGHLDDDGCPDIDNDADGIDDVSDKCPDDAEDPDGFEDEDGCPDEDNDGDGIEDGYDSCPDEPEDLDGDRDDDGCPDNDRDRDGVPDDEDKCPEEPEDTDGFGDEDGCPEEDFDGDGVPDDSDQCPDEPEDMNGVEDEDGCPEAGAEAPPEPPPEAPSAVQVTCDKVVFPGKVYFNSGSDEIQKRSHDLLDQIASALNAAEHVKKVRVEGHTDDRGRDAFNMDLSQRRADSVREYLVDHGVDSDRLVAQGFGETQPIADNATQAGRDTNRRVDFVVTEKDPDCK
ncbi:MAG: OmpA family protein [Myxococcales bacterium]